MGKELPEGLPFFAGHSFKPGIREIPADTGCAAPRALECINEAANVLKAIGNAWVCSTEATEF